MEYILNNRKTNMEPENGGPLEEEIPIKNPVFSGSMLVFWGVSTVASWSMKRHCSILGSISINPCLGGQ